MRNKKNISWCVVIALFFCATLNLYLPISNAEELKPIQLQEPQLDHGVLLMKALKERKSTRSFKEQELPLDVLSNLLWAAAGINRPSGMRTVPSAKNWQEIDVYVAMKQGLYLYNAQKNLLEPMLEKDIRSFTGKQLFVQKAPLTLIYVADFSKMDAPSSESEFYAGTDTGFISQNVYLFCASEGLATVVLGWVDKDALKKAMNLPKEKKVILTQPVGYPE
jgi:SagB-type dehydrogenase family enzyme